MAAVRTCGYPSRRPRHSASKTRVDALRARAPQDEVGVVKDSQARKRGPRGHELGQRTGSGLPRRQTEFDSAIQVQLISLWRRLAENSISKRGWSLARPPSGTPGGTPAGGG